MPADTGSSPSASAPPRGRWTIWIDPDGRRIAQGGSTALGDTEVPVVPCDAAAVERMAEYLWVKEMRHTDHPNSVRAALRWWDNASPAVRQSWLDHARTALQAAGGLVTRAALVEGRAR